MKEMISSNHNHHNGKTCRICSIIANEREKERNRMKRLAEFAGIVSGEDHSSMKNVASMFPMNRYRLGFQTSRLKAGSRLPTLNNKIVLHPERFEKARRLAELARFVRG